MMMPLRLRERRWGCAEALVTIAASLDATKFAMLEAAAGRARDAAVIYGAAEAMLESVGATGQATVMRVQDHISRSRAMPLARRSFAPPSLADE